MEIKGELTTKVSKNGSPYQCIVLKLTPTYEKIVFLTSSEIELLKITQSNNK